MKTVSKSFGLFARLGATVTALLFAQQAMALGTDPGVQVQNQATVTYQVGGNNQAPVDSNLVEFVVDRRVDFTVNRMGTGLTTTVLGTSQVFVDYYVTNLSNGDLDFNLAFTQLVPGDGDIFGAGTADTGVDMDNVTISVSAAVDPTPGTGDGPDPVFGGPTFIDDLPEDQSIRVRLYADAPAVAANNSIAGLSLDATAADPTSTANLEESASWTPGSIDNVFANASGATGLFAVESDNDGFLLQAATLSIVKSQAVISDPFGSGRAIPGARIEYTITISNTGAAGATSISISDLVDGDVTFVADAYNGAASNVEFDRGTGTNSFCLADAVDANSDGCTFDGTTLTIAGRDDSIPAADPDVPIDVAAGATVTVNFVVEIPAS